jgi:hypothetical protein
LQKDLKVETLCGIIILELGAFSFDIVFKRTMNIVSNVAQNTKCCWINTAAPFLKVMWCYSFVVKKIRDQLLKS